MARPTELVPGNCYFELTYTDDELKVPIIQTLVFDRVEELPGEETEWLFIMPDHLEESDGPDREPLPVRQSVDEQGLCNVLDIRELRSRLADIAPDHPIHPVPAPGPATPDLLEFDSRMTGLLEREDWRSLNVRIRGTDDGFIVTRKADGGLEVFEALRARTETDLEARIRSVFDAAGLPAIDDHVSNGGRTRLLTFDVADHATLTVGRRLLTEAYAMRRDDNLIYDVTPMNPTAAE